VLVPVKKTEISVKVETNVPIWKLTNASRVRDLLFRCQPRPKYVLQDFTVEDAIRVGSR